MQIELHTETKFTIFVHLSENCAREKLNSSEDKIYISNQRSIISRAVKIDLDRRQNRKLSEVRGNEGNKIYRRMIVRFRNIYNIHARISN